MKLYRLFFVTPSDATLPRDWHLSKGKVVLGEKGRGRKAVVIPIMWDGEGLPQSWAVAKTDDGLVLVGSDKAPTEAATLAVINANGGYSRGRDYSIPKADGLEVLALGWAAFGAAGGVGSADHALVRVQDGTAFRLRSKYSAYWHEYKEGEWKVYDEAEWRAKNAIEKFFEGEGVEWL